VELQWRARDDGAGARVSAFHARYENIIDFDFATFKLVNRNAMEVDGVQVQADARLLDDLRVSAHATFSDISGEGGFEPLNRPETYGGVIVDWRPSQDWMVQSHTQFVGEQDGSSIPTGSRTLDAYVRSDLAVTRRIGAARVFVTAENLFDARIEENVGFLSPGRALSFGVGYSF
jgi:outer membrane cobalamin receptor